MSNALAELLDSPTLLEAAEAIRQRLEVERERRNRFYEEIRDDQKAEFINGEVIVSSPAKDRHLVVKDNVHYLIGTFVRIRVPDGKVRGEKALCVFPRNDYEPDLCYFGPEKSAMIEGDTMKFPIPDFAIEILSPSTGKRDRGIKFEDYAAHGVREYWIIDPEREILEQYLPGSDGTYELALKSGSGEVASAVIGGLKLQVRALFDEGENLAALRAMLVWRNSAKVGE